MATIKTRPLVIGVAVCVGVFVGVAVGVGVMVGVFVGVGTLMIEGKKNLIGVGVTVGVDVGVGGAALNFWMRWLLVSAT